MGMDRGKGRGRVSMMGVEDVRKGWMGRRGAM